MFLRLFLLFTIIPFIEVVILVRIGSYIGFWPTILLIIVTGIAGAYLSRLQGYKIIMELRATIQAGRIPTQKIFEGIAVLIASVLLITPGVLTDLFGLLLLHPAFRIYLIQSIKNHLVKRGFSHTQHEEKPPNKNFTSQKSNIEDAEFDEIND